MTKKGAEILRKAQQTGQTSEEARESQREINERADWDPREMLPELFDSERRAFGDD